MDSSFRTPLLEIFRRGDVPRDVRLLAAQEATAPNAIDQLSLLALLAEDADTDVRSAAEATLARVPSDTIGACLARRDAPEDLRTFFVARGVVPGDPATAPADVQLFADEKTPDEEDETAQDEGSVLQRLANMTVPEKVKAAMKGTREMRGVLVRDPNKIVAMAVLSSPKLTETEVEAFARAGSVGEDVLRTIARNRAWIKNYTVVLALVKNGKTPVAVSMALLSRLNDGDMKRLSTDRNIPEPLRIAARKKMVMG
jgi:hypothetical protein